jgi:hypothetical protein
VSLFLTSLLAWFFSSCNSFCTFSSINCNLVFFYKKPFSLAMTGSSFELPLFPPLIAVNSSESSWFSSNTYLFSLCRFSIYFFKCSSDYFFSSSNYNFSLLNFFLSFSYLSYSLLFSFFRLAISSSYSVKSRHTAPI